MSAVVLFFPARPSPELPTLAADLLDLGITSAVTQVIIDHMVAKIDETIAELHRPLTFFPARRPRATRFPFA